MMNKYEIDEEKSRELYEKYKGLIDKKMCYNNIFSIVSHNNSAFREGSLRVAYGYAEIPHRFLVRHCFIVDKETNKVLDPTIFALDSPVSEGAYFAFRVFEDTDEYLDAIMKNNLLPELYRVLSHEEKKAEKWALANGYLPVG